MSAACTAGSICSSEVRAASSTNSLVANLFVAITQMTRMWFSRECFWVYRFLLACCLRPADLYNIAMGIAFCLCQSRAPQRTMISFFVSSGGSCLHLLSETSPCCAALHASSGGRLFCSASEAGSGLLLIRPVGFTHQPFQVQAPKVCCRIIMESTPSTLQLAEGWVARWAGS
jgi:hypothetical protein